MTNVDDLEDLAYSISSVIWPRDTVGDDEPHPLKSEAREQYSKEKAGMKVEKVSIDARKPKVRL